MNILSLHLYIRVYTLEIPCTKMTFVRRTCSKSIHISSLVLWNPVILLKIMRLEHGKRQLARPRLRWEDNIRMDLREIWCMHLAQDRDQLRTVLNTVMTLRVP
jgi:hypothetical protein